MCEFKTINKKINSIEIYLIYIFDQMAPNLVFLSFIFTHKVNLIVNKVNLLTSGVRLLLLILFNLNVTKKHYCYLGVMH